jgi:hypothetical protein
MMSSFLNTPIDILRSDIDAIKVDQLRLHERYRGLSDVSQLPEFERQSGILRDEEVEAENAIKVLQSNGFLDTL